MIKTAPKIRAKEIAFLNLEHFIASNREVVEQINEGIKHRELHRRYRSIKMKRLFEAGFLLGNYEGRFEIEDWREPCRICGRRERPSISLPGGWNYTYCKITFCTTCTRFEEGIGEYGLKTLVPKEEIETVNDSFFQAIVIAAPREDFVRIRPADPLIFGVHRKCLFLVKSYLPSKKEKYLMQEFIV
jgi:hypothetical protein